MAPVASGLLRARVQTISGDTLEVDIEPHHTVADVKALLEQPLGFPREFQTLVVGTSVPGDSHIVARSSSDGHGCPPIIVVKSPDIVLQDLSSEDDFCRRRALRHLGRCQGRGFLRDTHLVNALVSCVVDSRACPVAPDVRASARTLLKLLLDGGVGCPAELSARLKHEDPKVRIAAVACLGFLFDRGDSRAIAAAEALLEDPHALVRFEAIRALRGLIQDGDSQFPNLVRRHVVYGRCSRVDLEGLEDRLWGDRRLPHATRDGLPKRAAIAFLREYGSWQDDVGVRALVAYATDSDASVRAAALRVMSERVPLMQEGRDLAMSAASVCLEDPDWAVRLEALLMLCKHDRMYAFSRKLGEKLIPAMREALSDAAPNVRQFALLAARALILEGLQDPVEKLKVIALAESTSVAW